MATASNFTMKEYIRFRLAKPLIALAIPLSLGYAQKARATVGDEGAEAACRQYWQELCPGPSEWAGNCNDLVYIIHADDLMRSSWAEGTDYPLREGINFLMLRADETPLSAEERCAIQQNFGAAVEGTTGINFNTFDQAKAYFMAGMAQYIRFPTSDVPENPASNRGSWGKIKSIFR